MIKRSVKRFISTLVKLNIMHSHICKSMKRISQMQKKKKLFVFKNVNTFGIYLAPTSIAVREIEVKHHHRRRERSRVFYFLLNKSNRREVNHERLRKLRSSPDAHVPSCQATACSWLRCRCFSICHSLHVSLDRTVSPWHSVKILIGYWITFNSIEYCEKKTQL